MRSGKETKSESSPAQLTALRETCWQKTTSPQTLLHLNNIKKKNAVKTKIGLLNSKIHSRLFTGDGTVVQQSVLDQFTEVVTSIILSIALSFNKISPFN